MSTPLIRLALQYLSKRIFLLLLAAPCLVAAQDTWPTKPIRMVVPWGPGGGVDIAARIVCESLTASLGQPCVVENRAGAAGNIGTNIVAKSTDGHTIGLISASPLTVAGLLNPKLPFNPDRELQPISMGVIAPLAVVVSTNFPGNTPQQILAELKKQSGNLHYGSSGVGAGQHLGFEAFMELTGIEATHVPYSAGGQAIMQGLFDGSIQAALVPVNVAYPHIKTKKLKIVGVTSATSSPLAPELPPLKDVGITFNYSAWNAFMAPATMPKQNIDRLNAELQKAMNREDVKQKMLTAGWETLPTSTEGVRAYMDGDSKLLGGIIKRKNIVIE